MFGYILSLDPQISLCNWEWQHRMNLGLGRGNDFLNNIRTNRIRIQGSHSDTLCISMYCGTSLMNYSFPFLLPLRLQFCHIPRPESICPLWPLYVHVKLTLDILVSDGSQINPIIHNFKSVVELYVVICIFGFFPVWLASPWHRGPQETWSSTYIWPNLDFQDVKNFSHYQHFIFTLT